MCYEFNNMADTWLETLESLTEYCSEHLYGPPPGEVLRRAGASIRSAISKLERERNKVSAQEKLLLAGVKTSAQSARSFADLKPSLFAVANARRSAARIDKLALKMRRLQQQLIETEVHSTTATLMHGVTNALAQASAMTGGAQGVHRTVLNYEKQQALLEMTQESFDQLEDEEADEDTADEMLAEIAAEVNLQLAFELPTPVRVAPVVSAAEEPDMVELMQRLENLRAAPPPGRRGDGDGGPSSEPPPAQLRG
jgi:division protein CdvB (Snf7/Vps24/ESCRT-III family)